MKHRFLFGILIALGVLAAPLMSAYATGGGGLHYDVNVHVDRDCNAAHVTANPGIVWEDNQGRDQTKWVPGTPSGTGDFPWGAGMHLSGAVSVTWRKYTSSDWGQHWTATSQYHSESEDWSANKPGNCYRLCSETVAVYGEWSDWITDPVDHTQQYRTQTVTFVDARDRTTVCGSLELEEGQSLYCYRGSGLWVANGEEPPEGATPGFCPPYYPCHEVVYGDTLEGIAIQMFGGPMAAYNGGLVVCESAVGDWGQGCVRSATIPAGGLLRGMFVCPAPSPDTGFALGYLGH
jgi:hypothetical protein